MRPPSCSSMPRRRSVPAAAGWNSRPPASRPAQPPRRPAPPPRWLDPQAAGQSPSEAAILAEIKERDARDRGRAIAPLTPAPDAHLLDTTHLDIDAAFAAALALVKPKVEEALKAKPRG